MGRFLRSHWRGLVAVAALALLFLFVVFVEPWAFPRLLASGLVFWARLKAFALSFSGGGLSSPSILSYVSSMGDAPSGVDSGSLAGFWQDARVFFRLLVSKGRALGFLSSASSFLMASVRFLLLAAAFWLLARLWLSSYFRESSFGWSRSSVPLRSSRAVASFFASCFGAVRGWVRWFVSSDWLLPFAILALYGFNAYSYCLDLVGVYFWFFASFDFLSLLDFAFSLVVSFFASLRFVPFWLWPFLAYAFFRWLCFRRADRLVSERLIPADQAVLRNDTGVFTLILGKMRAGKTKLSTLMSLIQSVNDREDAYAIMDKYAAMFPDFPWQAFEDELSRLRGRHREGRKGLANVQQAASFASHFCDGLYSSPRRFLGYDVAAQRDSFYDGCKTVSLREALMTYAQAFFVYRFYDTFVCSNYSIRSDEIRLDAGHLVLWDDDLFHRDNRRMADFSSFSHVVRWDMLRLGRRADPDDPFAKAAGPGVYVFTEFDKERGNKDSNVSARQDDSFANPKNDFFDYSLMLGGHLASIDNHNFFKVFADQQRSGSLSLSEVAVAQSIFTVDPKNVVSKNALPFWWLEPIVIEKILAVRASFYRKYRFAREDRTLLFSLVSWLGSLAYSVQSFVENRYGYDEVGLVSASADSSGKLTDGDAVAFYAPNFLCFSDRYESACMGGFLNDGKLVAVNGFADLPVFSGVGNKPEDWASQGSYLVADLSGKGGPSRIARAAEAREGAPGSKTSRSGRGAKGRPSAFGGGRHG